MCLVVSFVYDSLGPQRVYCSPPGSSVHGDSPGKNTEVGCHAFLHGTLPTHRLNPGLLYCRRILYHLSHQGSPCIFHSKFYFSHLCMKLCVRIPVTASQPWLFFFLNKTKMACFIYNTQCILQITYLHSLSLLEGNSSLCNEFIGKS